MITLENLIDAVCGGQRVDVIEERTQKPLFKGLVTNLNDAHKVLLDAESVHADKALYQRDVFCVLAGYNEKLLVYVL